MLNKMMRVWALLFMIGMMSISSVVYTPAIEVNNPIDSSVWDTVKGILYENWREIIWILIGMLTLGAGFAVAKVSGITATELPMEKASSKTSLACVKKDFILVRAKNIKIKL